MPEIFIVVQLSRDPMDADATNLFATFNPEKASDFIAAQRVLDTRLNAIAEKIKAAHIAYHKSHKMPVWKLSDNDSQRRLREWRDGLFAAQTASISPEELQFVGGDARDFSRRDYAYRIDSLPIELDALGGE